MARVTGFFPLRIGGKPGAHAVRRNGKMNIIISTHSSPRTTPLSEVEKKNRQRFKNAAEFAKAILKCPAGRAFYEELASRNKLNSAYQAAFTDYCNRISEGH